LVELSLVSVPGVVSAGDPAGRAGTPLMSEWKLRQSVGEDAERAARQDGDQAERSNRDAGAGINGIERGHEHCNGNGRQEKESYAHGHR
jgi:hypothetical protein